VSWWAAEGEDFGVGVVVGLWVSGTWAALNAPLRRFD